jgi:hypothetical protein
MKGIVYLPKEEMVSEDHVKLNFRFEAARRGESIQYDLYCMRMFCSLWQA